jgi:site-specific DNA recombinase
MMTSNVHASTSRAIRCAIYTRKSTDEGLDKEFTTLDAQRDAAEAYIASQRQEGWRCLPDRYDDGGFTGGNMDRPALRRLLADIAAGKIDVVVIYKLDRLSRSLLDFARMMEIFDRHGVTFVSVTQQLNSATSMGRLMLNVLLSFAQFERELISERTRDKIAATRRRGKWAGGHPVLGYDVDADNFKLSVNEPEAQRVRQIFAWYCEHRSLRRLLEEVDRPGWRAKSWQTRKGKPRGGRPFSKSTLHYLLSNVVYCGKVRYKQEIHVGEHEAIVDQHTWDEAQRLLQRDHSRRGQPNGTSDALLKGLLFCKSCGAAMVPTHCWARAKKYQYYTCGTRHKRGAKACRCPSLPASEVEACVLRQLRTLDCPPDTDWRSVVDLLHSAWEGLELAERSRILQCVLTRIDYNGSKLALTFDASGIHGLAQELIQQPKEITS